MFEKEGECKTIYYFFAVQTTVKGRLRTLTTAISCLVSCSLILSQFIKLRDDLDFQEKLKTEGEDLTNILESRLKFLLLQLVRCYKECKKR